MLQYLLQILLFHLAFLLVYEGLLKKEKFFTYNRIFLLLSPILAILLPLVQIPELQQLAIQESVVRLPEILLRSSTEGSEPQVSGSLPLIKDFVKSWYVIYGFGFLLSLFLFLCKYRQLRKFFNMKGELQDENFILITIPNSTVAFTFFRTIYLGSELKGEERYQILAHEKVHVEQRHTLDLLYFEILRIIMWFNPLVYFYQARITELHEYTADATVVETVEKKVYFQQLLNAAFSTRNVSFINQFFHQSIIKKRIVMLHKSDSKKVSKLKYFTLIPLLSVMLTYVACSEETPMPGEVSDKQKVEQIKAVINDGTEVSKADVQKINSILGTDGDISVHKNSDGTKAASDQDFGDVPFAVVEEVPVYPGCGEFTSDKELKSCFSEKITAFVNKKFDTSVAKSLELSELTRIYVQFRITKTGSVEVVGVRAPHAELEVEARRVVEALPAMQPGKQHGTPVGVLYSLPITFKS